MRQLLSFLLCLGCALTGLTQADSIPIAHDATGPSQAIKPHVGLGFGTLLFQGELGGDEGGLHAGSTSPGYRISLSAPVAEFLDLQFYSIFGTVTINEYTLQRRLNMQSEIRMTGAAANYNFRHFIGEHRLVTPWISLGFEGFEFLSKTDLFDANGNQYHYWSDGTIRSIDEQAFNKNDALMLQRDHVYETDLRALDTEGQGNYPDRSWAIPLGIGVQWKCGERFRVRAGTEFHFTLTDRIDNIADPEGMHAADARNDRFVYTSVGLSYDLSITSKLNGTSGANWGAASTLFAEEDGDRDGVNDFLDECPFTPEGLDVDAKGCPLDGDNDGVPDYLDSEPNTAPGAAVDADGITLDDDYFRRQYLFWTDTIPYWGEQNRQQIHLRMDSDPAHWSNTYSVKVAPDQNGLTQAEINLLLSFKDVSSTEENGEQVYMVGAYDKLPEAIKRKVALEGQGIDGSVTKADDGTFEDMSTMTADLERQFRNGHIAPVDGFTETGTFYRVQIGAFQGELSGNVFADVPDVLSIKGNDGLTRYSSMGYDSFEAAANRRFDLLQMGFTGAFVTVYSDGTRITLADAGLSVSPGFDDRTDDVASLSVDPDAIRFTVELGVFDGSNIETQRMNQFLKLGNVRTETFGDGSTHFITGNFELLSEAADALARALEQGIESAQLQGMFNSRLIPLEEAIQLLGADHPKAQR